MESGNTIFVISAVSSALPMVGVNAVIATRSGFLRLISSFYSLNFKSSADASSISTSLPCCLSTDAI